MLPQDCERRHLAGRAKVAAVSLSIPPPAPRSLTPPSHAKRASADRGELVFWQMAPDIIATHAHGAMTRELSQFFLAQLEPAYASGDRIYGFHNWLGMESYDSACRLDLTAWVLKRRKQTVAHIAAASRMVAMGVSVANLALGSLFEVHTTEASLQRALNETLKQKRG